MPKSVLILLLSALALSASAQNPPSPTLLFPAEAVNDLSRTTLETLFETWPPQPLPPEGPEAPGDYVQYQHGTLTYCFGPFLTPESFAAAQNTLNQIRQELIQRDPKFSTSTLSTRRIDFPDTPGTPQTLSPPPAADMPALPEKPEETAPAPPPSHNKTNPLAFWLSTLMILAAAGWAWSRQTR